MQLKFESASLLTKKFLEVHRDEKIGTHKVNRRWNKNTHLPECVNNPMETIRRGWSST